jgi:hypothetical protein
MAARPFSQAIGFGSIEEENNARFEVERSYPNGRDSKRVGALGFKVGMTSMWDKWGTHIPMSVIQLDRC